MGRDTPGHNGSVRARRHAACRAGAEKRRRERYYQEYYDTTLSYWDDDAITALRRTYHAPHLPCVSHPTLVRVVA